MINTSKTNAILVRFQNKSDISPLILTGQRFELVSTEKLLRVFISYDLKWCTDVDFIVKKASQRVNYIQVLKDSGVPQEQLIQIYTSIIR